MPATTSSHPLASNASISLSPPLATSRPRARIATRLHSASASLSTCELKKTVHPRSRRPRISARTSRRPSGSRPDIGSSKITSSGSLISAWAMPTRCSMPFENLRSCSRRSAPMPTSIEQAAGAPPALRGVVAEERAEIHQQLLGGQVVVEVRVLRQIADAALRPPGRRAAGPEFRRGPPVGNTSCISSFSVVVLPAPFGPRNPKTSPVSTSSVRRSSARYGRLRQKPTRVVLGQLVGGERALDVRPHELTGQARAAARRRSPDRSTAAPSCPRP